MYCDIHRLSLERIGLTTFLRNHHAKHAPASLHVVECFTFSISICLLIYNTRQSGYNIISIYELVSSDSVISKPSYITGITALHRVSYKAITVPPWPCDTAKKIEIAN
jgi:hypothetical protein